MNTADADRISHDICRHLPEIAARGCELHTAYGVLVIEPHEARAVYRAVERILAARLRLARLAARAEGAAGASDVCGRAVS